MNSWDDRDPIFVVGNGRTPSIRSNAMTVLKGGKVGIRTDTPAYTLDITSDNLATFSTASVLWQRLYGNSSNQDQLRILHRRFSAGTDWTTAEIRLQKTVDVTDMGYISFKYNYLDFGIGNSSAMIITNGRNVGIGTTNPGTYKLYVNGTAYSTGGWTSSDIRWKKNIIPLTNVLSKIIHLNGVNYEWENNKYPEINFDSGQQIGLVAQEVENICPELVKTDDNGYKAVSYEKLSVLLVEGMKEQQQIIEKQQSEIDHLKSLENELSELKLIINGLITNQISLANNQPGK